MIDVSDVGSIAISNDWLSLCYISVASCILKMVKLGSPKVLASIYKVSHFRLQ